MAGLITPYGYPMESHSVVTKDGYVLGVFRIPRSPAASALCRGPVLLQHGLLDSSASWVVNGPKQSLAFLLADAGWDVWLANSRGNGYSRNHTTLSPAEGPYWNFSWDEMALYDLPAVVDHVLDHSSVGEGRREALAYVGHSQGTTILLAALASQPRLRASFSSAALMAPVFPLAHMSSLPLGTLSRMHADQIFDMLGVFEFSPANNMTSVLFERVCEIYPPACVSALTAFVGFNAANVPGPELARHVRNAPSGTSVRNLAHWAQMVRVSRARGDGVEARYDFGTRCRGALGGVRDCNQRSYGSERAPLYQLAALAADPARPSPPLAVFQGGEDILSDVEDVDALLRSLPAELVRLRRMLPSYAHIDFVWGQYAAQDIYEPLIEFLH